MLAQNRRYNFVPAKTTIMKKWFAMIFLLIGILSVILSISAYGLNYGSYENNKSYGGDAYTGIQNAAAQSANNVIYTTKALAFGTGSILLIVGLSLIALSIQIIITYDDILAFKSCYLSLVEKHSREENYFRSISNLEGYWTCDCGRNNSNDTVCCACGMKKSEVLKPAVSTVDNSAETGKPVYENEEYIRCPKCNTVQKKGRKVCFDCGLKFEN